MMNKRGFELAISTLVLLIIGLLVLASLIYGFSYGWGNFWNKIIAFSGGSDTVSAVISACETSCSVKSQYDYCTLKRKIIENGDEKMVTCNELELSKKYELRCPAISCT